MEQCGKMHVSTEFLEESINTYITYQKELLRSIQATFKQESANLKTIERFLGIEYSAIGSRRFHDITFQFEELLGQCEDERDSLMKVVKPKGEPTVEL